MCSKYFLFKSGTVQPSAGYPTGNNMVSFSDKGRSRSFLMAGPQFNGVDVKDTNPAC